MIPEDQIVTNVVQGMRGTFLSTVRLTAKGRRLLKTLKGLARLDFTIKQIGILQIPLQSRVVAILADLKDQGFKPVIHNTGRTLAQAKNNKRKGVGIVNSLHRGGLAADIIDSRYGWTSGTRSQRDAFWRALAKAIRKNGLRAGADFGDMAHVEAPRSMILQLTGTSSKRRSLEILEAKMEKRLRTFNR